MPVVIENLINTVIGLILAGFIGGLSNSALAAMGTVNTSVMMIYSLFNTMIAGSAVLVARFVGAGDQSDATDAVEQAVFLTTFASLILCGALALLSSQVIHLVIPTAEPQLFNEAVIYFRLVVISYPCYLVYVVATSILRAAGSTGAAMLCSITLNVLFIVLCAVFVKYTDLGISGIGLAYILSRSFAVVISQFFLFRFHMFHLRLKHMLRPNWAMIKRILRIGIPASLESISVQGGYLVANTMIVGLGTHSATVYQVANQVHPFSTVFQTICSTLAITLVGQALGEHDVPKAKNNVKKLWFYGMAISMLVSLIVGLLGTRLTSFFSSDPIVIMESARMLWIQMLYNVFAISINVIDPSLRTGGDVKSIMIYSSLFIWLVRIPLTYLFCYVFSLDVVGIYMANIVALAGRAIVGLIRCFNGKWTRIKV